MNYRDFFQKIIYKCINPLIHGMIKAGITPNMVTTIGFLGNILAAAFFIYAAQQDSIDAQSVTIGWGGFIILASGLFDMMDGRLARVGNMSSSFGAMWDSTLDRYSELVSLFGIVLIFVEDGQMWFWFGVVTFAAMVGSVMVSYVRARAEGLGRCGAAPRARSCHRCHRHYYRTDGVAVVACRRYDTHCRAGQYHRILACGLLLP